MQRDEYVRHGDSDAGTEVSDSCRECEARRRRRRQVNMLDGWYILRVHTAEYVLISHLF